MNNKIERVYCTLFHATFLSCLLQLFISLTKTLNIHFFSLVDVSRLLIFYKNYRVSDSLKVIEKLYFVNIVQKMNLIVVVCQYHTPVLFIHFVNCLNRSAFDEFFIEKFKVSLAADDGSRWHTVILNTFFIINFPFYAHCCYFSKN